MDLSWSIRIRTRYGGTGTRVPSSGPDSGTCVPAPAPENSKVNLNFIAAQLSSSSICVYSLIQSLNLRSTAYQCPRPLSLSVSVSLFQFKTYINHKRDPVLLCYLLNSCIGYAFTVHFPSSRFVSVSLKQVYSFCSFYVFL